MHVLIPDEVRKSPRLHVSAEIATELLQSEAPLSGASVHAEWSIYRDELGREGLDLSLSDGTDAATTRLPDAKLLDKNFLLGRIIRIWGDLLQKQSHTLLARFQENYATIGED